MLLLEKNIIRRKKANKVDKLESKNKLDIKDDKEYEIKVSNNSKDYTKEAVSPL